MKKIKMYETADEKKFYFLGDAERHEASVKLHEGLVGVLDIELYNEIRKDDIFEALREHTFDLAHHFQIYQKELDRIAARETEEAIRKNRLAGIK